MDVIQQFWKYLHETTLFEYQATCGPGSKTGWEGSATGSVVVQLEPSEGWLHFHETCRFVMKAGNEVFDLKNQYRWHLFRAEHKIRLEHWRRGVPVHLLDLVAAGVDTLKEEECHLCGMDRYRLEIRLKPVGFDAIWEIKGPKKDEMLYYRYS